MRPLYPITLISILALGQIAFHGGSVSCDDKILEPNEAGRIMVLMYHGIGPKERKWIRSIDNFKKDLDTLYEKGYRPVRLSQAVKGQIDIKAGHTPVVLTFDDGRQDNFRIIGGEEAPIVDPESAVGILEKFQEEHPDFNATATFFLNGETPFGEPEWVEYKLNYLVSRGMDVGNHTTSHDNLRLDKYSKPETIQRVVGKQALFLMSKISEKFNYRVDTLALCHGARPKDRNLFKYLKSGNYNGFAYENMAVLNVGSGPMHSPYTAKFNPMSIPRIRAGEIKSEGLGIADWIRYFDRFPSKRYISDGDPNTVTVPKDLEKSISSEKLYGSRLVVTAP